MEFTSESPALAEEHLKTWTITPGGEQKNKVIDEIIQALAQRFPLNPFVLFKYRLCLDEAITNSITHGCQGVESPSVTIHLYWSPSSWALRIIDPGPGFEKDEILDPEAPEAKMRETGRGIPILMQYVDKLVYSCGGCEQTFWIKTRELLP